MFGNFADFAAKAQKLEMILQGIFSLLRVVATQTAQTPADHARLAALDEKFKEFDTANKNEVA